MPYLRGKKGYMEKIYISKLARKDLNMLYGTSNVSKALNFRSQSLLAKEIRHRAVNFYDGKYMYF